MMKLPVLLAIVMTLLTSPAWAEQTLVLNSALYTPFTSEKRDGELDMLYQELSNRLGIKIDIQILTAAQRSLINVVEGVVDGDAGRIEGLDKQYPNIVRVPIPVTKFEVVVFSRNFDFRVDGPESLKPYNIGIVRGWKIVEAATAGAASITMLESADLMFSMLDKNRIDIAVLEKKMGIELIKRMGVKNIKIMKPALLESYWYLYLNKKHIGLVPRITAELRNMEEDGTRQRIHDGALSRYPQ
ncbi:MAG: transporter substrate-binding domain-containing protein [Alphaproteobacteria bacterium]|nr:transporter substrate-binding domain-containing protein [Alphaproteobacteria bacterium]